MRIIVSDTSALIDLRKGSLIEALLRLPYQVQVPDLLFEDELLSLSPAQKRVMRRQGLRVVPLPSGRIDQCSDSEIRIISRRVRLRISESKEH